MGYTVIGNSISPFVRKVMVLLKEKGIPYENEDVNPFSPPEGFRQISPLGRIPAFRHDDRIINDSSVICHYIERLHPTPALYPKDPYECAQAEWIEEYMDGGFIPIAGPKVFLPLVLRPLLSGQEPDETEPRRVIAEELPPYFDYLNGQLRDSGHFVGDSLTIADLTVAGHFINARLAGVNPDAKRWPKLAAFLKKMHARPSIRELVEPVLPFVGKRWVEFD